MSSLPALDETEMGGRSGSGRVTGRSGGVPDLREVRGAGAGAAGAVGAGPGSDVERGHPGGHSLPLDGPLGSLLPEGVRPGSTVTVSGSVGLALALTAAVGGTDRWVAGVGWHDVGLAAAHELGVPWDRLVLVTAPDDPRQWATALSAAVEGFDVVVACPTGVPGRDGQGRRSSPSRRSGHRVQPLRSVDARRIRARARERGAVLVVVDERTVPTTGRSRHSSPLVDSSDPGAGGPMAGAAGRWWPEPAEVELRVTGGSWAGLGDGHGHLQGRQVAVEATGRGRLARPRRLNLWLPGTDGSLHEVELATEPPARAVAATWEDGPEAGAAAS